MRKDINLPYFKAVLEQRLAEIRGARKPIAPVALDPSRMGRLSRMDAMQQQAMSQAADRLAAVTQRRIETALERMVAGDYGYCCQCEEEIALGRLNADPSAVTCITCAQAGEHR